MTADGGPRVEVLPSGLTIVDAHVPGMGIGRCAVRLEWGRVAALGRHVVPLAGDEVVDADGGSVLPGLHDHHVHLRAMAADTVSVHCGPPDVHDAPGLRARLLAAAPRDGWIRGTGYDEAVAGRLDRWLLDRVRGDVPVRVQHRSGMTWTVNSAAASLLGLSAVDHPGVERDAFGTATGTLIRMDDWLARRAPWTPPSLAGVSRRLAAVGVTGVTDATVTNDPATVDAFVQASESGALLQRVMVMGRQRLPAATRGRITIGPVKIVLDETDLPPLPSLVADVRAAHAEGRGVAIHTVSRATLAFGTEAFRQAGPDPRDRVEHASVCPAETAAALASLGVTVVTQPAFVHHRGDRYLVEVDPDDRPWLYPIGLLDRCGTRVAGSTDAPCGPADPWLGIATATHRRTAGGQVVAGQHAVGPRRALDLFLGPLNDPAGPARRLAVGGDADLVLLDRPLDVVLTRASSDCVRMTVLAGHLVQAAG